MLYICATPIGNLEDITLRVLRILEEVDLIVAEDTRQTKKLLNHFKISNRLLSLHQHNEYHRSTEIVTLLKAGKKIALVSDAGMPGISDPGAELIRQVLEEELSLTVLPGANAAITAVVQSGLITGPFYFQGFLPRRKKELLAVLKQLQLLTCPVIFYEAPHRLLKTISYLKDVLGDRQCAVSRELTKKFEETVRGKLSDIEYYFSQKLPRGEFVITVEGLDFQAKLDEEPMDIKELLTRFIDQGMTRKDAIDKAVQQSGVSKNEVYQQAIELKYSGE